MLNMLLQRLKTIMSSTEEKKEETVAETFRIIADENFPSTDAKNFLTSFYTNEIHLKAKQGYTVVVLATPACDLERACTLLRYLNFNIHTIIKKDDDYEVIIFL